MGTAAGHVERLTIATGESEVEFEDGADSSFVGMHAFDRYALCAVRWPLCGVPCGSVLYAVCRVPNLPMPMQF